MTAKPSHLGVSPLLSLCVAAALISSIVCAQTNQVLDLQPGAASSTPQRSFEFAGFVYFAASSPGVGVELWRTDGTPGGTALFADINPGAGSSEPQEFALAGGLLYFQANNGANGAELWRTDGTPGGTLLVVDLNPGVLGSNPRFITEFFGEIYFQANNGTVGTELFKNDGTIGTAALVMDIYPGALPLFGPNSSNPADLTEAAGLLFFRADNGTHGVELWAHDGFTTFMVMDIFPGVGLPFGTPNSSFPLELTEMGGSLFFVATDAVVGTELWASDGFFTAPVDDVNPGPASAIPSGIFVHGGLLYLSATNGIDGEELHLVTDPFSSPTLVADILAGSGGSQPSGFAALGSFFVFTANTAAGRELWRSDGTAPGTTLIADIQTGPLGSNPFGLTPVAFGNRLIFRADDGSTGAELWATDGTAIGTSRILDINPCQPSSNPSAFASLGANAVFAANNGTSGIELWVSDGVVVAALGNGQAPRPGIAVFDVNNAVEAGGAPVCSNRNGPYFAQATAGMNTTFSFSGAPSQPIILISGPTNPAVFDFGAIGKLDVGTSFDPFTGSISGASIVANGLAPDLLNQIFNLSISGTAALTFTTPASLVGVTIGLQAFQFTGGPTVIATSNAVAVTFN